MSKVFYDRLIVLKEVDVLIKKTATSKEEKEELWDLVDEIVHHKVLDVILGKLPTSYHKDFLEMFHSHPHDECLFDYLKDKIDGNIEELIKQEIGTLATQLLEDIKDQKNG